MAEVVHKFAYALERGDSRFPPCADDCPGCAEEARQAQRRKQTRLRNYFAGQALAGLLANPTRVFERWPKHVVRDAYDLADEMVKAGESTHGD